MNSPFGPPDPSVAPPPPRYLSVPQARPVWTYVFLGLNTAIGVIVLLLQGTGYDEAILLLGMKINALIAAGEYWRLLTATFLHAGLLHLFSNMLALYAFGLQVEAPFGPRRFVALYLLSGLAGSALSYLLSPNPSLGASGAVYGLLGALVAFLVRNRRGFGEFGQQRLTRLLGVLALNLMLSLSAPFIDLWGHAGGLLGGLVLGWGYAPVYTVQRDYLWGTATVVDEGAPLVRALTSAAVVAGIVVLTVMGTVRWS